MRLHLSPGTTIEEIRFGHRCPRLEGALANIVVAFSRPLAGGQFRCWHCGAVLAEAVPIITDLEIVSTDAASH